MDKFDKLKIASSSFGERIKTSGAQMGRTLTTKVREILQSPTPESRIVDDATAETMEEPNWGLNMRICAMINAGELDGAEIVKAIKRKLSPGRSEVSQRLSLDLLETCSSNCEKVFSEVASEKVLDDMVRMIDDPKTEHGNRVRAMQLIRAWGENEDLVYLPVFRQTYENLKNRAIPSGAQEGDIPPQTSLESYLDQQQFFPPESYPVPESGPADADRGTYVDYGSLWGDSRKGVEEKKEFLVITRNSLDILSSILNSEAEPKPIKDDLTVSMFQKCKQSLPVVQRIIESTSDDEGMMFEALNVHEELQSVISKYEEVEASLDSAAHPKHSDQERESSGETAAQDASAPPLPKGQSVVESANFSKIKAGGSTDETKTADSTKEESSN